MPGTTDRSWGRVGGTVTDSVNDALGRRHRSDVVRGSSGGPAGNARLTAAVGLVLLVLISGELVTLLDVKGYITWHVVLGLFISGFVIVKVSSTGWRVVRYYGGNAPYRSAGPPSLVPRVLGPVLVLTTLVILGSGIALLLLGRSAGKKSSPWLAGMSTKDLHENSLWVFLAAAGLHLLLRLIPAVATVTGRLGRADGVPGRAARTGVIVLAACAAAIASVLLVGRAAPWHHHDHSAGGHSQREINVGPRLLPPGP